MFFEISAIASALSFSASPTGTESATGKTNSEDLCEEFLQEKHADTAINRIKKAFPFIRSFH
jgi:hypothetical protein